jgi:tetratricopeptide (TPR) repeat protein
MIEPRRVDDLPEPEATHRDGQIEALLMDGLDRYFTGRYEDAIHLWTRVLFLDRSHARARAYIDRARSALVERQRQSEEKLQASRQLLDQGETDAARMLLSEAVAAGGDDDRAAALRVRLDRTERLHGPAPVTASARAPRAPVPGWSWSGRSHRVAGIAGTTLVAVLLLVLIAGADIQEALGVSGRTQQLAAGIATPTLPVLSSAEVAIVRARTLYDRGRLAEALVALDRVSPDSSMRPVADRLRIEIQQMLLESSRRGAGRDGPAGAVPR